MTDIIIPIWNQSDLTIKCLQSIARFTAGYQVIAINNGSEPEEWKKIYEVLQTMPHIAIHNPQNLGFVKAVNQGIKLSTAPYLVLMNNDTEAVSGWIEKLQEPLIKHENVMLSGPLTTTPESWQGQYPKDKTGYTIRKTGMLAFFCTMFKAEVFKKIGLLDEDFGVGFGDDDDYCHRVLNAGYSMALVQDLVIPHHHRSTFRKIYDPDTIRTMQTTALAKYKSKHGIK